MVDMYTGVNQHEGATSDGLNSQTIWSNDYEKEIPRLLDAGLFQQLEDMPRATSAPPHLQDRLATAPVDSQGRVSRIPSGEAYTDIRFDDDYAAFYKLNAGQRNLPPPIDSSGVYTDLQNYAQQVKEVPVLHGSGSRLNHQLVTSTSGGLAGLNANLNPGGLETVQEQQTSARGGPDDVLQSFNQLAIGAGSPAPSRPGSQPPLFGVHGLSPSPGLGAHPFEAAMAAGAGTTRSASAFAAVGTVATPPPICPSPPVALTSSPLPSQMNPLNVMLQPPNNNFRGSGNFVPQNAGGSGAGIPLANTMEYQAAYQAAYHAALLQHHNQQRQQQQQQQQEQQLQQHSQQQHQANSFLAGQQGGHVPGLSGNAGRGINGQNMPQPGYGAGNAELNAAATAAAMAAAAAAQVNRFEGSAGNFEKEDRRGKRFPRNRERERERDNHFDFYDSQYNRFSNLEEVVGQVMQVAQDQNGCRFLQRKFDEGGSQAVGVVFDEIQENIVELMKDPFGNYLVQKLLDRCSEEQRTQVVKTVAARGELVSVALSTHGTRAVQKLIETLSTKEQRQMVIDALKPGVVSLIKDLNGNHVVQRCLQRLGPEDSQFIYDAACSYCIEVASHRHGCCVLQRCIDFATAQQRRRLVEEIARNALVLSQDAFGNYVVQYVLELGRQESSQAIMHRLQGHYAELAMQKFSSNVVEKCLKLGGLDDNRERIVREIMLSPGLPRLLQDPYGNYVIQSALTVTSGQLHQALVDCIRPYLPSLRGTPHGKRILQKVDGIIKTLQGDSALRMIGSRP